MRALEQPTLPSSSSSKVDLLPKEQERGRKQEGTRHHFQKELPRIIYLRVLNLQIVIKTLYWLCIFKGQISAVTILLRKSGLINKSLAVTIFLIGSAKEAGYINRSLS